MEQLYKNAVLCGEVDFHCLLCGETFTREEAVKRHMRWETHRKNLTATQYVHKYKNHLISKIKNMFYCEPCNVALSSLGDVTDHIAEETHVDNLRVYKSGKLAKQEKHVTRFQDSVLLYGELVVGEKPWHGIVGKLCVLCQEEPEGKHLQEPSHVRHLIRSKVQKGIGTAVFRNISDTTIQCMTCNKVVPQCFFATHCADSKHKSLYEKRKITNQPKKQDQATVKTIPNVKRKSVIAKKEKFSNTNLEMDSVDEELNRAMGTKNYIFSQLLSTECLLCNWHLEGKSVKDHINGEHHKAVLKTEMELRKNAKNIRMHNNKNIEEPLNDLKNMSLSPVEDIIQRLDEFQKEGIMINLETRDATCDKCNFRLQFNANTVVNHIRFHKKILESPDFHSHTQSDPSEDAEKVAQSLPVDPEQYAKDNSITFDKVKSNCYVCDSFVVGQLERLQDHVKGVRHQTLLKVFTKNELPPKEPKDNYQSIELKSFVKHVALETELELLIINHIMCVNTYSYALLKMLEDGEWMKCYACYEEIPFSYRHEHCDNEKHQKVVDSSLLILSLKNEFVREIRPNLYHCCYCNDLHPGWSILESHLKNSGHLENKMQMIEANNIAEMMQEAGSEVSDDEMEGEGSTDSDSSDDEPDFLQLSLEFAMRDRE